MTSRTSRAARGPRWIAILALILAGASVALNRPAAAASCAAEVSMSFSLGSCRMWVSAPTAPDAATPTLGLQIGGVECTCTPLAGELGAGDLLSCLARVLRPFLRLEDA